MRPLPNVLPMTRFMLRWGIRLNILGIVFKILLGTSFALYSDEFAVFLFEHPRLIVSGVAIAVSPAKGMAVAGVVLAAMLASCVLALLLLRTLAKVVESIRAGDPFVPENGQRLRLVAWLLLYLQLVSAGAGLVLSLMFSVFQITLNELFSPLLTGVLTVLLAFILARVFESGSTMRSDIRDTI